MSPSRILPVRPVYLQKSLIPITRSRIINTEQSPALAAFSAYYSVVERTVCRLHVRLSNTVQDFQKMESVVTRLSRVD